MLGHTALIDLFLQHGADIEYEDRQRCSPLLLAARNNHVSAAGLLSSRGADLLAENMIGYSPISAALSSRSHETIKLLLGALESHSPDYINRGLQGLPIAASGGVDTSDGFNTHFPGEPMSTTERVTMIQLHCLLQSVQPA
jgi:ankyrin repeat protein